MRGFLMRYSGWALIGRGVSDVFALLLGVSVAGHASAQQAPVLPAPLPDSTSQHFHSLPPEARSFFDQQDQLSRLQSRRERLDLESQVLRLQLDYKLLQRQQQEERLVEVMSVMHWDGQPHALLVDDQSRLYLVREGTQLPKIGRVERIEGQGVSLRDGERQKGAARVLGFRAAPAAGGGVVPVAAAGSRPAAPPLSAPSPPPAPAPPLFPAAVPRR